MLLKFESRAFLNVHHKSGEHSFSLVVTTERILKKPQVERSKAHTISADGISANVQLCCVMNGAGLPETTRSFCFLFATFVSIFAHMTVPKTH